MFTNDDFGTLKLATIDIQNNDKTLPVVGSAVFLVNGAQKGVWFTTGNRIFTAVDKVDPYSQVSVWPQPANDFISVGLENSSAYQIFDLSGRIMQEGIVESKKQLDISSLHPGIYLLSLNAGDKYFKTKLVKQ